MIVSREDAVSILSKWAMEATPVSIALLGGATVVWLSGVITEGLPKILVVTYTNTSGKMIGSVRIALVTVEDFDYSDAREAPEEIRQNIQRNVVSTLTLKSNRAQCCIYELVV